MNPLVRLRQTILADINTDKTLRIATVNLVRNDGTSLVTDDAAHQFIATGTNVPAGQRALIEGKAIIAQVPTLTAASFYV